MNANDEIRTMIVAEIRQEIDDTIDAFYFALVALFLIKLFWDYILVDWGAPPITYWQLIAAIGMARAFYRMIIGPKKR